MQRKNNNRTYLKELFKNFAGSESDCKKTLISNTRQMVCIKVGRHMRTNNFVKCNCSFRQGGKVSPAKLDSLTTSEYSHTFLIIF